MASYMTDEAVLTPAQAAADPRTNGFIGEPTDEAFFSLDLREIFGAINRNKVRIAAILALALAAGTVISLLMVPKYYASSQVLVEQQADQIIEGSELAPAASYVDAERFLRTQVDVIRSMDLSRRVVESEGLAEDPAFFEAMGVDMPSQEDFDESVNRPGSLDELRSETAVTILQEQLAVNLPDDSRLITIGIQTRDPEWSARLANAFAENYIAGNLARKFDSSSYAREYLAQQLAQAREELEQSERALNQYSRIAGLVRIPGQGEDGNSEATLSITTNSLVQLNEAAGQAAADRVLAERTWQSIANQPVLSIPQVLSNPAMQALIQQRAETESELALEQARHLEDHPNVVALKAQVKDINQEIQSLGQSLKRSVKLAYDASRERESALFARVDALTSEALAEQDLGVRFAVLQREAETKRRLYDTLLERFNEINATAGAASNNVSLVDEAAVPREASSPNIPFNLLISLLLGLGAASGYVFLREHFDDTIRVPADVEAKLGLPLLGLIPQSENEDVQQELEDPKTPVSEAYATLITNLRFSTPQGMPHIVAVTSAQQSEGKSTTSYAMAHDFAEFGKRVLLLDMDMRRPTLHREAPGELQNGLGSYLVGESEIADVIKPSGQKNLDYMSALPTPPDPPTLLNSGRMDELFEQIRCKYDCIVLDCPPLLGLSDTAIISTHADAVLMVIDAQAGHRGSVKTALRRMRLINAHILGAILTKFDPRGAGRDYSYNYYRYED